MASLLNRENREFIAKEIVNSQYRIKFNKDFYQLYKGSIKEQLEQKIREDLGDNVYYRVKKRLSTINVWKKIVDKLSGIYARPPVRRAIGGSDSENEQGQSILDQTVQLLNFDQKMNTNNEIFNAFGYSSLQIARNQDKPFVRTIPNYQFITISMNPVDPTEVDIVVMYMDPIMSATGEMVDVFHVYTKDEFIIMDKKGDILTDMMIAMDQDGSNPFGELPFINWNDNDDSTMSELREDDSEMTLLVPLLLTDTNYGLKYQIFSIFYTINAKLGEMVVGPDALWEFNSEPESDKDPQVGTIKPEFDSDKVIENIKTQVSLWLDSKGMKPGSIGTLNTDNAASGISKMVDQADVSEEHDQQASLYARKEIEFWNKYFTIFYPFWRDQGLIEDLGQWPMNCKVVVEFMPQVPIVDRSKIVNEVILEIENELTSKKRGRQRLYPEMTKEDLAELDAEIDEEKQEEVISFEQEQNRNETEIRPS